MEICLLSMLALSAPMQDAPDAAQLLQMAEQCRASIATAHIEWSREKVDKQGKRSTRLYTSRIANEERIYVHRGDESGVIARGPDGQPLSGGIVLGTRPIQALTTADRFWTHQSGSIRAEVRPLVPGKHGAPDVRSLGMTAAYTPAGVSEALATDQSRTRLVEEDGMPVITIENGNQSTRLWIDPSRGYSPVRVARVDDGKIQYESRSELQQYDGVWYPAVVRFYRTSFRDGKEPFEIIRVHGAAFNQPGQPRSFRPEDIGIEPGVNILHFNDLGQELNILFWDGARLISPDEFGEREKAGELRVSPAVQAELARLEAERARREEKMAAFAADPTLLQPSTQRTLTAWEKYVLDFIERYELNTEQAEKARSILKECQETAATHIARHKGEFEALEKEYAALDRTNTPEKAQRREERRGELFKPLDDIFEKELKPRLEKLPTRAQRAAVEKRGGKTEPERK
ncbi:MAG: hypothetical protein CHACPFDD_01830 [Phycisphaerae bacterium]|nr:hypothetical protein [Phycisphaerae bacterium]